MKAYERFLKYIKVHTASDSKSSDSPTTTRQFNLANMLVDELQKFGIENAYVDEYCYVYAEIPATVGMENCKRIAFISHMDTSPDFCGENVKPQIIENYDGTDVILGTSGKILKVSDFPDLKELKGRTLITTDGNTLLGADDKAGIAEIMTAVEKIISEKIPHGKITICFTPDEEVGKGTEHIRLEAINSDFGYTLDGGYEGEIVYENFNAASAVFKINGFNVHPGTAKNTLINAQLVAMEINSMLPSAEIPQFTEGYEGFYHLCEMHGTVENATLEYIIRDHSSEMFNARKQTLKHIEKIINEKYGENTVTLEINDQYKNMSEKIKPCFHIVENAIKVIKDLGIKESVQPIRGGTDGAGLSFMGLPCPNLGTGGYAYHGPYEHITVEGMETSVNIILGIIKSYAVIE